MSETIDGLIIQIEELRANLIKIKEGRSYTDPEVVTASEKLDQVLNKYQELIERP
ncbi:MAG TPA: aspartyl-phosphate phosphatase Spo0E family protein [Desulfosporosinus sp.]